MWIQNLILFSLCSQVAHGLVWKQRFKKRIKARIKVCVVSYGATNMSVTLVFTSYLFLNYFALSYVFSCQMAIRPATCYVPWGQELQHMLVFPNCASEDHCAEQVSWRTFGSV